MSEFNTLTKSGRCKVQVGACRFYGSAAEVCTTEEAADFLNLIRGEHPEIKNHCWAYRIGLGVSQVSRYSDGGEPSLSAGPPILRAIDHLQLTNTMVIVTRYFGEKQGVGGLIRAFHLTATTVLAEAGVRKEIIYTRVSAICRYEQLSFILHELEKVQARNLQQEYGENVTILAEVQPQEVTGLKQRIAEWTRGGVELMAEQIL